MSLRLLANIDFTTGPALEVGYPAVITLPLCMIYGVGVVRVLDVATPGAIRYEAVSVASWSASGRVLAVHYFTGLEVSTRYIITLEVIGA